MKRKTKDETSLRLSLSSGDDEAVQQALLDIHDGIVREIKFLLRIWCSGYSEDEIREVHVCAVKSLAARADELAAADHVLETALSIAFHSMDKACLLVDLSHLRPAEIGHLAISPLTPSAAEGAPTH